MAAMRPSESCAGGAGGGSGGGGGCVTGARFLDAVASRAAVAAFSLAAAAFSLAAASSSFFCCRRSSVSCKGKSAKLCQPARRPSRDTREEDRKAVAHLLAAFPLLLLLLLPLPGLPRLHLLLLLILRLPIPLLLQLKLPLLLARLPRLQPMSAVTVSSSSAWRARESDSTCVAGVHAPAKPACGRHVVGTVVL